MSAKASLSILNRNMGNYKEATKNIGRVKYPGNMTAADWQQIDSGCRAINSLVNATYIDSVYTLAFSVNEEVLGG